MVAVIAMETRLLPLKRSAERLTEDQLNVSACRGPGLCDIQAILDEIGKEYGGRGHKQPP
jgi:hypothetical protein